MILEPRWFLFVRIVLAAFVAAFVASRANGTIRYTVSIEHPEKHTFHVSMEIPDVAGEVIVQMPAWNALYQIPHFSAHLPEIESFAGSDETPLGELDKRT